MERIVKKEHVGKFGKLSAGAKGFEKTIYGSVLYVDYFGAVFFVDNEDIGHRFPVNQVSAFEEQEFKDKTK
jgi:hypothetical protein